MTTNRRGFAYACFWMLLLIIGIVAASLTHSQPPRVTEAAMAGETVRIDIYTNDDFEGHGSGVHIGGGFIVTASHIAHGDHVLKIITNRNDTQDAELLWDNPAYDVALLRIKDFAHIKSAELACRQPVVGEPIEVVGYPLFIKNSHTWGHVAAALQDSPSKDERGQIFTGDVTIAPGNSGGPVFDSQHKIIGLADAIPSLGTFEGYVAGLGLFVPSVTICSLLARV